MASTARAADSMSKCRRLISPDHNEARSLTFLSRAVSRFVRSEEGKKVQKKVYEQVSRKLESIQPGIFDKIPVS